MTRAAVGSGDRILANAGLSLGCTRLLTAFRVEATIAKAGAGGDDAAPVREAAGFAFISDGQGHDRRAVLATRAAN